MCTPPALDRKPLVLVVDQEPVVLRLCKDVLEREGYSVLAAGGRAETLKVVQTAALLEIAIVDLPCAGLIAELQADGLAGPVVCMSTYPLSDLPAAELAQLRSFYFLPKPFTARQLAAIVAAALAECAGRTLDNP
jgi:DNA-binding NtrC family response regulator